MYRALNINNGTLNVNNGTLGINNGTLLKKYAVKLMLLKWLYLERSLQCSTLITIDVNSYFIAISKFIVATWQYNHRERVTNVILLLLVIDFFPLLESLSLLISYNVVPVTRD